MLLPKVTQGPSRYRKWRVGALHLTLYVDANLLQKSCTRSQTTLNIHNTHYPNILLQPRDLRNIASQALKLTYIKYIVSEHILTEHIFMPNTTALRLKYVNNRLCNQFVKFQREISLQYLN